MANSLELLARTRSVALAAVEICFASFLIPKGDLAAEQRQNVAWGQIGELQRVNRSPRFSHEYQQSSRLGLVQPRLAAFLLNAELHSSRFSCTRIDKLTASWSPCWHRLSSASGPSLSYSVTSVLSRTRKPMRPALTKNVMVTLVAVPAFVS